MNMGIRGRVIERDSNGNIVKADIASISVLPVSNDNSYMISTPNTNWEDGIDWEQEEKDMEYLRKRLSESLNIPKEFFKKDSEK